MGRRIRIGRADDKIPPPIQTPDAARLEELGTLLKTASINPDSSHGDMRWGFVFYNWEGKRIAGLYFDNAGRRGAVDDSPLLWEAGVLTRVRDLFLVSLNE